jgi:hypothetical protein
VLSRFVKLLSSGWLPDTMAVSGKCSGLLALPLFRPCNGSGFYHAGEDLTRVGEIGDSAMRHMRDVAAFGRYPSDKCERGDRGVDRRVDAMMLCLSMWLRFQRLCLFIPVDVVLVGIPPGSPL